MRIQNIQAYKVFPRWVFVEVITDTDIIGYGEASLEGRATTVVSAVEELKRYLIGRDPFRIERHWQAMYRSTFYRGGPVLSSAISGIDQALWDIKGKALGVPVFELLGGAVRNRIRVYAHIEPFSARGYIQGSSGSDAVEVGSAVEYAELARKRQGEGFRAVKMVPVRAPRPLDYRGVVEDTVAKVAAVREAIGDAIDIAIDIHGRVLPAIAVELLDELAPFGLLFAEEPCPPESEEALAAIRRKVRLPIAAGERIYNKWEALKLLARDAVDVLQPDLCHAGGLSECKKIAALAEAYHVLIAPHCPLGPVALAACLQLDACTQNFLIQEVITFGEGYLKEPFQMVDGYVALPDRPGLGIELDESALSEMRERAIDWDNPMWYREDGSVSTW